MTTIFRLIIIIYVCVHTHVCVYVYIYNVCLLCHSFFCKTPQNDRMVSNYGGHSKEEEGEEEWLQT